MSLVDPTGKTFWGMVKVILDVYQIYSSINAAINFCQTIASGDLGSIIHSSMWTLFGFSNSLTKNTSLAPVPYGGIARGSIGALSQQMASNKFNAWEFLGHTALTTFGEFVDAIYQQELIDNAPEIDKNKAVDPIYAESVLRDEIGVDPIAAGATINSHKLPPSNYGVSLQDNGYYSDGRRGYVIRDPFNPKKTIMYLAPALNDDACLLDLTLSHEIVHVLQIASGLPYNEELMEYAAYDREHNRANHINAGYRNTAEVIMGTIIYRNSSLFQKYYLWSEKYIWKALRK